jgi:hypothetical protein
MRHGCERRGALHRALCVIDDSLEHRAGTPDVTGDDVMLSCQRAAATTGIAVPLGRQVGRAIRQRSRGTRGAASDHGHGGGLELGCDLRIGLGGCASEVPGPLFLVRDDRRQARMDLTTSIRRRSVVDGRREERMGKSDVIAARHQHALSLSLGESRPGPFGADGGRQ